MASVNRKRKTAEERREEVVQAAIVEFATYGYYSGSTQRIAEQAGISQPYVLRLFSTKKALFIAAVDRVCSDIVAMWRGALDDYREDIRATGTAEGRLNALRGPYLTLVQSVVELRLVLQASAASEDEDIQKQLKEHMKYMFDWVRTASGAPYETVQAFWAQGMTLTVAASIGARADVKHSEWARAMMMMSSSSTGTELQPLHSPSDGPG